MNMKAIKKRHRIYQSPRIKIEQLPKSFCISESVGNIQAQKERFLKDGKTPTFVVKGDTASVEELPKKAHGQIRFEFLGEAEYILKKVKEEYGVGENYLDYIYGTRVLKEEANDLLMDYINENALHESLDVFWSDSMTCSARMVWRGPHNRCNKPESRRYSLWVNGTAENPYLRKTGFLCLLDHEIGTHFFRTFNDGLQPWFSDRKRFDLRGCMSFENQCSEEGLAAIHTALRAREHYLWLPALVYYTACKSTEMNFKQLFDHLAQFVQNPEQRWKHVMRVKRGLVDSDDLGGYGKDQCYFEGAVNILRNIDNIDFALLMSGKICYDEVRRIKRLARMNCIRLPSFMRDMDKYREHLKRMAALNGLHKVHPVYEPSAKYLFRLKQREEGKRRRKVRKKKKLLASLSKLSQANSESQEISPSNITSSESQDSILSFDLGSCQALVKNASDQVDKREEARQVALSQTPSGGLAGRIGAALMNNYSAKPKDDNLVIVDPMNFVGTCTDSSVSETDLDNHSGACSAVSGVASESTKNGNMVVIPLSCVRNKASAGDYLQKTSVAKHNPAHKPIIELSQPGSNPAHKLPVGLTQPGSNSAHKLPVGLTQPGSNSAHKLPVGLTQPGSNSAHKLPVGLTQTGSNPAHKLPVGQTGREAPKLDRAWLEKCGTVRQSPVQCTVRQSVGSAASDKSVVASVDNQSVATVASDRRWSAGDAQRKMCTRLRPATALNYTLSSANRPSSGNKTYRPFSQHSTRTIVSGDSQKRPVSSEQLNSDLLTQTCAELSRRREGGKSAACLPPLSKSSSDASKRRSTTEGRNVTLSGKWGLMREPQVSDDVCTATFDTGIPSAANEKKHSTILTLKKRPASSNSVKNGTVSDAENGKSSSSKQNEVTKIKSFNGELGKAKRSRNAKKHRKSASCSTGNSKKKSSRCKLSSVAGSKLDNDSGCSATREKLVCESEHPDRSYSSQMSRATSDMCSVDVDTEASRETLPSSSCVKTESLADSVQSSSNLPIQSGLTRKRVSLSTILSRPPASSRSAIESRKKFEAALIAQSAATCPAPIRTDSTAGLEGMSWWAKEKFLLTGEMPEACTGESPGQNEQMRTEREKGMWKNAQTQILSKDGRKERTVTGRVRQRTSFDSSFPADIRAMLSLHAKLLHSGLYGMQGFSGGAFQLWPAKRQQSKSDVWTAEQK